MSLFKYKRVLYILISCLGKRSLLITCEISSLRVLHLILFPYSLVPTYFYAYYKVMQISRVTLTGDDDLIFEVIHENVFYVFTRYMDAECFYLIYVCNAIVLVF